MTKTVKLLLLFLLVIPFVSCSDKDSDDNGIAGTWVRGDMVMKLGKDGSYRFDVNDSYGQYRVGTYVYSPSASTLTINIQAVAGYNGAYTTMYIAQLTGDTLILIYTDGDIEGFYTRKK